MEAGGWAPPQPLTLTIDAAILSSRVMTEFWTTVRQFSIPFRVKGLYSILIQV